MSKGYACNALLRNSLLCQILLIGAWIWDTGGSLLKLRQDRRTLTKVILQQALYLALPLT
ncbi:MAG: hypothetical protein CTY16_02450 [Methylobacter sp.]|uniref:hypothetical protein n=1 Tax=Methylovulum miyakonense TaxID=645578 RepID=UPI000378AA87|nr:hypothetical protein [Methylovulum miyakonense]PPD50101.1 MAG: hypothetical protein CTY16_02450 [Methylobacter sp.]